MANILPANSEIPFYIVINQSSPPPYRCFYNVYGSNPLGLLHPLGLKKTLLLVVIQFNCTIRTGWQSAHKKFF